VDVKRKMHWICTMCDHYKRAAAVQVPYRGCGYDRCYSPIAGGWFPDYAGPLRAPGMDNAHAWCFMCGAKAVAGVRVADRFLGVCQVHTAHLRVRVQREGGTVRDVYLDERRGVLACRDDELRPKGGA
jgi:hypothetical protein